MLAATQRVILVAVALLTVSGAARAGGFYVPERGARALSLGGAQVAGADDLNAQWLNPAGLARLGADLSLYVDLALIQSDQRFARAYDAETARKDERYANGFPVVKSTGGAFFDPSLAVASRLGTDDFVFAFGVYGPYAGTNEWPQDGPQRYSLVFLEAAEVFIQASAAWEVNDVLSVGLGLQWILTHIKQRLVISAYPGVFGWAEQRDLDVLAQVDVTDAFTPGANLGLLITPISGFEVGLSGQLPVSVRATGTLKTQRPAHYYFADVETVGDDIEVDLEFPAIARLGLRVFEPESWSVEVAAVYEAWSAMQDIAVRPGPSGVAFDNVPGIGTYEVKPFDIRQDHVDVVSARLGGWWRPGGAPITVRAGAFFETSSLPDNTTTVVKIDNDKLGVGLGGTLELGDFAVDLAFGYVKQLEREVTDSVKYQVNPLYDEAAQPYGEDQPKLVGDGTYGGSFLMFATSIHARF